MKHEHVLFIFRSIGSYEGTVWTVFHPIVLSNLGVHNTCFPTQTISIKWRHLFRCIVQKINGSDSMCDTNTVVNSTNKHEINIFFCSLSHSFFILTLSILLKMNTIKLCPYAKWVHLVTCNLMPCHTYFNYYTNCKTC